MYSCIVVRICVHRNYDKGLMETGKFSDNLRVREKGLVSGVDKVFKSSNYTFQNICDRLGPSSCILLTRVDDDFKILVP